MKVSTQRARRWMETVHRLVGELDALEQEVDGVAADMEEASGAVRPAPLEVLRRCLDRALDALTEAVEPLEDMAEPTGEEAREA
jgi:hypothetical protein